MSPRSTARWAVASFVGGIALLALAALPLVAALGDGETLRRTALAVVIVVVAAAFVVVADLDVLGARGRRPTGRPVSRPRRRSGRPARP